MPRKQGYPELDEIDTTYTPRGTGDRVWIQRSRTILRNSHGWATVVFICDHRWPNLTWYRMVSIRRYRRCYGQWKERSAINVHAKDILAIAKAITAVEDAPVGEASTTERMRDYG